MNVAYNEISCADAARMLGMDYTFVTKLCKAGRINCTNVSEGTEKGRWTIREDEVEYLKHLRQKFGRNYMQKYRKDWRKGKQLAEVVVVKEPTNVQQIEEKPKSFIKSVVTNITTEEFTRKKVDIDDIAIKIGLIQDIKDKLEALEVQKNQLNTELEELRKEVMEYL